MSDPQIIEHKEQLAAMLDQFTSQMDSVYIAMKAIPDDIRKMDLASFASHLRTIYITKGRIVQLVQSTSKREDDCVVDATYEIVMFANNSIDRAIKLTEETIKTLYDIRKRQTTMMYVIHVFVGILLGTLLYALCNVV